MGRLTRSDSIYWVLEGLKVWHGYQHILVKFKVHNEWYYLPSTTASPGLV